MNLKDDKEKYYRLCIRTTCCFYKGMKEIQQVVNIKR